MHLWSCNVLSATRWAQRRLHFALVLCCPRLDDHAVLVLLHRKDALGNLTGRTRTHLGLALAFTTTHGVIHRVHRCRPYPWTTAQVTRRASGTKTSQMVLHVGDDPDRAMRLDGQVSDLPGRQFDLRVPFGTRGDDLRVRT